MDATDGGQGNKKMNTNTDTNTKPMSFGERMIAEINANARAKAKAKHEAEFKAECARRQKSTKVRKAIAEESARVANLGKGMPIPFEV